MAVCLCFLLVRPALQNRKFATFLAFFNKYAILPWKAGCYNMFFHPLNSPLWQGHHDPKGWNI